MARSRRPSVKMVLKWLKQGYGQGDGKAYRPFFHVRDVPSKGRSAIVEGLKTGRNHHYLSDIEYYHHVLAEFSPDIKDIREQYALLPWEETQEIANDLGIAHPRYRNTNTPLVMTSDLVLTRRNHELAVVSVKCFSDVDEGTTRTYERTLEKLRIEQEYWKRRCVPWVLSTEKNICVTRAKNLAILRTSMVSRELDSAMIHINEFIEVFQRKWEPHKTLNTILAEICEALGLCIEVIFCLFGRSVWLRRLTVDLGTKIDHFAPVKLI